MGRGCLPLALFLGMLLLQTCAAHRKILQTSWTDCTWLHPNCTSCTAQAGQTTGTVVSCLACSSPSYRVTADTSSCECSPGYFPANDDTKACKACGRGFFCSGSSAPQEQARMPCGDLLTTMSATARNASACITLPGVAYMSGVGTAMQCPAGTYNSGGNQRNCTDCPGEMVTAGPGATSIESCQAPPGYFYRNRQAVPCAVGSYKTGINKNTVCQACPDGTTTLTTESISSAQCSVVLPGYEPVYDPTSNGSLVIGANPCPIGSYSPAGQECTQCPAGLTTEATKCTSVSACVAPPGYGFYPSGLPAGFAAVSTDSTVAACPIGWFKAGYNLDTCVSCGAGVFTDAPASTSSDACFIPPGWGSKRVYTTAPVNATGVGAPQLSIMLTGTNRTFQRQQQQQQLVATKCQLGSYGADNKHYGLEPMPCQSCPEHTTTPDAFPDDLVQGDVSQMVMTSIHNCSNIAGYGWQHGIASACSAGYYSPGYDLRPCKDCGVGLTTARPAATGVHECIAKPGWQLLAVGAAMSCPTGTWSAGGTASQCQLCPEGSTTTGPASPSVDECSVCLPGWGVAQQNTTTNVLAGLSACMACDYGFYSPGGISTCFPCETGYTSVKQATDSSSCLPLWPTMDPYTAIATQESDLQQVQAADAASCQEACGKLADCQFWVYRAEQLNATDNGCFLKNAAAEASRTTYVAFKVMNSGYTVWQADTETDAQLGNSMAWVPQGATSITSPTECLDACDSSASCLGIWASYGQTSTSGWQCRLMGGEYRNGETSALHVVPVRINDALWAQAHALNNARPDSVPADDAPEPVISPAVDAPAGPVSSPAVNAPVEPVSSPVVNAPAEPMSSPAVNAPAEPVSSPAVNSPAEPVSRPAVNAPAEPVSSPAVNAPAEPVNSPAVNAPVESVSSPAVNAPVEPASSPAVNAPAEPVSSPAINAPDEAVSSPAVNAPIESVSSPAVNAPAEPVSSPAVNAPVESVSSPAVDAPAEPVSSPAFNAPVEPLSSPAANAPAEPVSSPAVNAPVEPLSSPAVNAPVEPVSSPVLDAPAEPVSSPVVSAPADPVSSPAVNTPAEPVSSPAVNASTEPVSSPAVNASTEPVSSPVVNAPADPVSSPAINAPAEPVSSPAVNASTKPVSSPAVTASTEPVSGPALNAPTEPVSSPVVNAPGVRIQSTNIADNTPLQSAFNNTTPTIFRAIYDITQNNTAAPVGSSALNESSINSASNKLAGN